MSRFAQFVKEMEMVSFAALLRSIAWFLVIVGITVTACLMLLSGTEWTATLGFQVVVAVLSALVGASTIGAVNQRTNRHTAREYVEAKERGKAQGEPARPVVQADTIQKVEVAGGNGNTVASAEPDLYSDDERG